MIDWRLTITIKDLLSEDDSDGEAKRIGAEASKRLRDALPLVTQKLGFTATWSLEGDVIKRLENARNIEQLNTALEALYQWGDEYYAWIA